MNEPKSEAETMAAAAAGYDTKTGQESSNEGERAWWDDIRPEDWERVSSTVRAYDVAFHEVGYRTALHVDEGRRHLHLWVRHSRRANVTPAHQGILKGAVSALRIEARWGGDS